MELLLEGLKVVLQPHMLLYILGGVAGGIIVGGLPGLSASTGIILFLPLTYQLSPVASIVIMCAIFKGAMFGGSISAILVRTPGTPSAAATVLDGYPMTQKGQAGLALSTATISSVIGGLISSITLILIAPQLARVALKFGPPEYFSLMVFGLTIIASVTGKEVTKGLIAGSVGLFLGTIGMDPVQGFTRFTFGSYFLMEGFELLPVMIGLFAVSQVFMDIETIDTIKLIKSKMVSRVLPSLKQLKVIILVAIFGGIIGTFLGIIPAVGGSIACFVAYSEYRKLSKRSSEFGTGIIEGVAAPESANNATTGGALVPLLTLGIPGDVVTAVMLGVFILIGIRPGPMLFREQPELINTLFASLFVIGLGILIVGLLGAKFFPRLLSIPKNVLTPIILMFCIVGSYSVNNSIFDIGIALIFGILGYLMRKYNFPAPPLLLGMILGPIAEGELGRALLISGGKWSILFTRPISILFMILAVVSLVFAVGKQRQEKWVERGLTK